MPCEEGGRDWNHASINQGMTKIAFNHQELGEGHVTYLSLEHLQKEHGPVDTLILAF